MINLKQEASIVLRFEYLVYVFEGHILDRFKIYGQYFIIFFQPYFISRRPGLNPAYYHMVIVFACGVIFKAAHIMFKRAIKIRSWFHVKGTVRIIKYYCKSFKDANPQVAIAIQ